MSRSYFVVLLFSVALINLLSADKVYAVVISSTTPTAFVPPPESYILLPNSNIEIQNMPAVHSQDGLPICCSETARTLYLQDTCKKNNLNCLGLKPEDMPSVLSIAAIAEEASTGPIKLKTNNPLSLDVVRNLNFVFDVLNKTPSLYSESCFSFDQFVAKYNGGSPVQEATASREAFIRLKAAFEKTKLEANYICLECLNKELQRDFDVYSDINQISLALKEKDFDRFLHKILLGGCKQGTKVSMPSYTPWPTDRTQVTLKNQDSLDQIKKILSTQTAVGLQMCPYDIPTGDLEKCQGGMHCLVISGYKEVCNPTNKNMCKKLLKVHNSWGADWQQQNNDGWLDAETLLSHSDVGRSSQLVYFGQH